MAYELQVVEGADAGRSAALAPGELLIGRSDRAHLKLSDESVSWEHAVIRIEGDRLTIDNLSANGTMLNRARVVGQQRLRVQDEIRLSPQCLLRVNPAGGEAQASRGAGLWGIAALTLAVVVAAAGLIMITGRDTAPPATAGECSGDSGDWARAFGTLESWLDRQQSRQGVPAVALHLFRDGWRYERSGNHERSVATWGELLALLSGRAVPSTPPGVTFADIAVSDTVADALCRLFRGESIGGDAEAAAAVMHFARRSLRWNTLQVEAARQLEEEA